MIEPRYYIRRYTLEDPDTGFLVTKQDEPVLQFREKQVSATGVSRGHSVYFHVGEWQDVPTECSDIDGE